MLMFSMYNVMRSDPHSSNHHPNQGNKCIHHLQSLFMPSYVFLCFLINLSFSTPWVSLCIFSVTCLFSESTLPCLLSLFLSSSSSSSPSSSFPLSLCHRVPVSLHLSVPLSPSLSIWGQEDSGHVAEGPPQHLLLTRIQDLVPWGQKGAGIQSRGPRRCLPHTVGHSQVWARVGQGHLPMGQEAKRLGEGMGGSWPLGKWGAGWGTQRVPPPSLVPGHPGLPLLTPYHPGSSFVCPQLSASIFNCLSKSLSLLGCESQGLIRHLFNEHLLCANSGLSVSKNRQ